MRKGVAIRGNSEGGKIVCPFCGNTGDLRQIICEHQDQSNPSTFTDPSAVLLTVGFGTVVYATKEENGEWNIYIYFSSLNKSLKLMDENGINPQFYEESDYSEKYIKSIAEYYKMFLKRIKEVYDE